MTTQLAWGGISWKAGYDAAGETENLKKTLQWSTDYLIAAHLAPKELVAQVMNMQSKKMLILKYFLFTII